MRVYDINKLNFKNKAILDNPKNNKKANSMNKVGDMSEKKNYYDEILNMSEETIVKAIKTLLKKDKLN